MMIFLSIWLSDICWFGEHKFMTDMDFEVGNSQFITIPY